LSLKNIRQQAGKPTGSCPLPQANSITFQETFSVFKKNSLYLRKMTPFWRGKSFKQILFFINYFNKI